MSEATDANDQAVFLTVDVVTAALANRQIVVDDIPGLINRVHSVISDLLDFPPALSGPVEPQKPAVPVKKSVTPDYIVCLECGKKVKMLKRHLSGHGLTVAEYRAKWELPPEYPHTAPNYSAHRSEVAKQLGLGKRRSS